ncbi:MAG: iron ABC transporter ATP-binding protein, partial [Firmicutes bacterium]|nr:iron ABC transporter ATP-binding protein [Bacillota bacterium]
NIAILSSLHDLNQAMYFGDRFFFLKDGVIRYSGGREMFRPDVIADIFGIQVRVADVDGQKFIIGGNYNAD